MRLLGIYRSLAFRLPPQRCLVGHGTNTTVPIFYSDFHSHLDARLQAHTDRSLASHARDPHSNQGSSPSQLSCPQSHRGVVPGATPRSGNTRTTVLCSFRSRSPSLYIHREPCLYAHLFDVSSQYQEGPLLVSL